MNNETSRIIVFAKAPIKGRVKNRLAKDLDESTVVNLYRNFGADIVEKVTAIGHEINIFYDPPDAEALMTEWMGRQQKFFPQTGPDLGYRMADAFCRVFQSGITRAVLIGTDFPDLPGKIISDAVCALESHDAIIGPTIDGGYYLIGFRSDTFHREIFEHIPWGTSDVFQSTMTRFDESGADTFELPKWRDIDVLDDLKALIQALRLHPEHAVHTSAYLSEIGLLTRNEKKRETNEN